MPTKPITIFSDTAKGCIFFENSTVSPKFLGTIQASEHPDLSDRIIIVRTDRFKPGTTDFRPLFRKLKIDRVTNQSGELLVDTLGYTRAQVINYINTEAQATGSSVSGQAPTITSSTAINLTGGETLNYELTADYGVGYEWAGLPSGLVPVDGNVRKLIGGSQLAPGTYNFTAKAVNYFGEDSQNIELTVSNPPWQDSKSVHFESQTRYMGANAALATSLERASNSTGTPWTISMWVKHTGDTRGQTMFYFGSQDTANAGHIEIRLVQGSRVRLRYGSTNNYLQLLTDLDSFPANQWNHVMVTYNGGQTGNQQGSLSSYYNQFKIYINGSEETTDVNHGNYGWASSMVGQNLRLGRFSSGNGWRNAKMDEVVIFPANRGGDVATIYNNGSPSDISSLSPSHWWRMGDGDTFPVILDAAGTADMIMYNMTPANIVTDTP